MGGIIIIMIFLMSVIINIVEKHIGNNDEPVINAKPHDKIAINEHD